MAACARSRRVYSTGVCRRRDLRILDAGCGSGGNLRFLRRYGSVIRIDLAAEALALPPELAKRPGAGIGAGVLSRMPASIW